MFIGRSYELNFLEELYNSSKAELFVLYGRRRVGKSELLSHFCKGKRAIFFTASQAEAIDNIKQLTAQIREAIGDPLLENIDFPNIDAVFTYLAMQAKNNRLLIILDEFQYWVMGDKSIPSKLQRFWDQIGKRSKLMLVLCGSSISMMMDFVLAERAPLYGRRTGQLELKPFDYRSAGQFFPNWSAWDKMMAYGVLGGIPAYLSQFDPSVSFVENLQTNMLRKGTFLSEESEFLLKTELRDTRIYASLLRAIAAGNNTLKDLTSKLNIDARAIATYLSNLQALHLIKREVSLIERAPEKSRKGRYIIEDNFLSFWHRFLEPNITYLETQRGKYLYENIIRPQISSYMGFIFETICRQYILYYAEELGIPVPKQVGRAWHRDYDLDIVAKLADGSYLFGECKWSIKPIDRSNIHILKQRVQKSNLNTQNARYVLFSAGGFKHKMMKEDKNTEFVTGKELF